MNKILLASRSETLTSRIKPALESEFLVTSILSQEEYTGELKGIDLILLDQDFTEFQALDFLMNVVSSHNLPVLVLTSPDEPKTAAEALRSGAHNFIIKNDEYEKLLPLAVSEGIKRFNDKKHMTEIIQALKDKVKSLEERLVKGSMNGAAKNTRPSIFTDIVKCLKSGEINLPAYPGVSRKFKEMTDLGASISEITRLLEKDLAISSKMISVANSPLYRGMVPIKTLEQALSRVGISETRNYVELITNRSLYLMNTKKYTKFLEQHWMHSLATAFACQELCNVILKKNPRELFAMGLFHDIGTLLLTQIIAKLENSEGYTNQVSSEQFTMLIETSQSKFGEMLIKKWKLGDEYASVARYVDDYKCLKKPSEEIYMVNLADKIARSLDYGKKLESNVMLDKIDSAQQLSVSFAQIKEIQESVTESMKVGGLF